MFDNGIATDNAAVGISGGAMAALAMLNGSDIYVGLRQGIVDLVNEGSVRVCQLSTSYLAAVRLQCRRDQNTNTTVSCVSSSFFSTNLVLPPALWRGVQAAG